MDTPSGALDVVGRDRERAALTAFLDDLGAWPAGMVLVGEAGAGKTTLWREGVDRADARGHRVLLARPAAAEALLAFAGLRDLLDEVFDEVVDPLPVPQARALEVALLRRDAADGITERTAVAAGLLTALRHLARDQPVVVALDDAQWLGRTLRGRVSRSCCAGAPTNRSHSSRLAGPEPSATSI